MFEYMAECRFMSPTATQTVSFKLVQH